MSNIKDVAKHAGVSVATVSNILNNKTSVSEELHQKVIKAMEELDYHPNFLATNLRRKKIGFIGVVVSSLTGHYHQILEGINQIAKEHRCQPILKIVSSASEEIREIDLLLQLSVSGIIVMSSYLNEKVIRHYDKTGVPVVFVDHYPINTVHNVVRFDNYQIVGNLTMELMKQQKTVGIITGSRFLGSEEECVRGYLDNLDTALQPVPLVFETDFNKERAFAGLINYLCGLRDLPDCIIASAAHLAKTVSEICSMLNMKDVSVFALSGDSWYKYRGDSMSYLRRDAIRCGIQAATLLFQNMEKPAIFETKQICIEPHGVVQQMFEQQIFVAPEGSRGKTLKLLLLESNVSKTVETLSRDFTAQTGIHVSVTAASQTELIRIILESARNHSSQYDIIMADMHRMQQLKQEAVFCRLNELVPLEKIMPRYIRDVRSYILSENESEDLYALPILAGYQMLAYRTDLFEDDLLKKKFYLKYGVQLCPPRTWNEFNLIAKFFTRQFNEESPVEYGTCLTGGRPEGIMAEFLPRQWSYKGKFFGSNGLDMVSVANLRAVKNLCESYQYSYPDCMDFLEEEQVQEFGKGDIAMISSYNVHLQDKLDFTNQKVRFARIPGTSALIGGWMLGINAYSKHIEESALFLNWEMSDRISVHSSLLGQISPFKSVFYDSELLTIYPWMRIVSEPAIALREKEFGTRSFPNDHVGRLEQTFSDNLWRAILGEIMPEEALKNTQTCFPDAFR